MKVFHIRTARAGQPPEREQQLAWHIAEVAAARPPVDPAAAEMVANRVIDSLGVGLAARDVASTRVARTQAFCHRRRNGAAVLGAPADQTVGCEWAAWANAVAIRELDLHDNFYGFGVAHPADAIAPLIAVAQQCRRDGADLLRGILTAYEVQCALTAAIDLRPAGIDHVAHLGPAVAAGLGSLLGLDAGTIFHAVGVAAHLSCAPLQARKGDISTWKAAAPAHVGKLAIEAVDRAMRGETGPVPIYEGQAGVLASIVRQPEREHLVRLPAPDEPRRAILNTYPKAHAAGYHAQALIDLAIRVRPRLVDLDAVESIVIHTKDYTHNYVGTGANDPEKMDPGAGRETLDHSIMYLFAIALEDGRVHHRDSYRPERAARPATVRLWHRIATAADPEWTRRYSAPAPLDKDHGGRVEITLADGSRIVEELAVADSHPRGARPFARADYVEKFRTMTEGIVAPEETERFLDAATRLGAGEPVDPAELHVTAMPEPAHPPVARGIFDTP